MRIRKEILEQINASNIIKAELIKENNVHPGTVQRWIDKNNVMLTTAQNMNIICTNLGKTQEEVLEAETTNA